MYKSLCLSLLVVCALFVLSEGAVNARCGEYEEWCDCANYNSRPDNCYEYFYPKPTPKYNKCDCVGGCICIEGYVRGPNGNCIPVCECGCGGDPNAHPGCDSDCSTWCPGSKQPHYKCPKDSCICNDGYRYDPKQGKCVHPKDCSCYN